MSLFLLVSDCAVYVRSKGGLIEALYERLCINLEVEPHLKIFTFTHDLSYIASVLVTLIKIA